MLSDKSNKTFDTLRLTFQASRFCVVLHVFLSVIHAAAMALATASFVDTATAILQGARSHNDIYMPLILLLLVLGVFTTIGSFSQLVSARISLHVQHKIKPEIVKIHAALDFKHIENADIWELIDRPGKYAEMWTAQAQWYERASELG